MHVKVKASFHTGKSPAEQKRRESFYCVKFTTSTSFVLIKYIQFQKRSSKRNLAKQTENFHVHPDPEDPPEWRLAFI
jgi:hypothetical protein